MIKLALPFAVTLALGGVAVAAEEEPKLVSKTGAEVIAWDADGKPDVVRVEGFEYKLCKGGRTDGCINPQDAGFDWGGREIDYWPGRPASEIDGPLPEHKPAAPKDDKQPGQAPSG